MKKILMYTIGILAVMASSVASAGTVIDAGTFTKPGDTTAAPSPYSGVFTDVYTFEVANPNGLTLNFSGMHEGMAGADILLTNTADGADFHLAEDFSQNVALATGSYVFTLSGFAMNALDSKITSDYNLEITAVPLPAAVWLFGSALVGFISFSARRKV
jgi:hypothetical protein